MKDIRRESEIMGASEKETYVAPTLAKHPNLKEITQFVFSITPPPGPDGTDGTDDRT